MPEEVIESNCARHGVDRHVFVHEAGHAVAGIDNSIQFRAVVLYDEASTPRFVGGLGYAPGAVDMGTNDRSTWVQPNVLGALRFVCAGFAAEQAVLEHALEGGFDQDIKEWRTGAGRKDAQMRDALDEFIGRPFMDVVRDTQDWAVSSKSRIVALADHLEEQGAPYEMPRYEVETFLRGL